ncbi:MAG TPA: hypothetical protein VGB30_12585 [bacterium]|jgi:hypothetical protein
MKKPLIFFGSIALGVLILYMVVSGNFFVVPFKPESIAGNWQGTYVNDVVEVGVIECRFYMDGNLLKADYDLQNGEIIGTGTITIEGREIRFVGSDARLKLLRGSVSVDGDKIIGELTINYTTRPTQVGRFEIRKL